MTGTIGAATTSALGVSTTSFTTVAQAQTALSQVQNAISVLGSVQNTVGTLQNRLQFAISLSQSQIVNTKAPRAASATRTSRKKPRT